MLPDFTHTDKRGDILSHGPSFGIFLFHFYLKVSMSPMFISENRVKHAMSMIKIVLHIEGCLYMFTESVY